MATSRLTAGNAVTPTGIFTGGNDGSLLITVGANGAQRNAATFSQYGDVKPFYNNTLAISTTSSYSFDPINGQIQNITFTNSIVVTMSAPVNIQEGAMYKLMFKAGDTGTRTFAWNTAYKFPSANAPLVSGSLTTGSVDIITFIGGPANTLIYDGHISDIR